jgi:hypothetical protein
VSRAAAAQDLGGDDDDDDGDDRVHGKCNGIAPGGGGVLKVFPDLVE